MSRRLSSRPLIALLVAGLAAPGLALFAQTPAPVERPAPAQTPPATKPGCA